MDVQIKKYYILIPFILFVLCFCLYDSARKNYEQEILLEKIKDIAESDIKFFAIFAGHDFHKNNFVKEIVDINKIGSVKKLLIEVDKSSVGGHNPPIYKCIVSFSIEKNLNVCFLGTVYEQNPNDFFLSDNFFIKTGKRIYSRFAKKPVRIKNMGSWMIKNGPMEGRLESSKNRVTKVSKGRS